MYSNKPVIETEIVEFDKKELDSTKRIKVLEEKVRMLSEQMHKMASTLSLNSRHIRKQNTDINNVTTAIHGIKRG